MEWQWREHSDQPWQPLPDRRADALFPEIEVRKVPEPGPWLPLAELRCGAVFETNSGARYLKSFTGCCYSLVNGRPDHFMSTLNVREIVLPGEG